MLDELLEKCFSEDKTTSSVDTNRVKTNVLSRIEREKPMKHFGIKALVIAAAMMIGGVMSVLLTASASTDDNAVESSIAESNSSSEERTDIFVYPQDIEFYGKEYATKLAIQRKKEQDALDALFEEKKEAAKENGGVIIEKELDETDVVGYVPPVNQRSQKLTGLDEEEMEIARRIEEEPESLGLIPAGKSETFEGGYRIVNRHYINTNEPVDGEKIYYSFRRVYTDDAENRLIASSYTAVRFYFGPNKRGPNLHVMNDYVQLKFSIFLDHTENGCLYEPPLNAASDSYGTGGAEFRYNRVYDYYNLRPNPDAVSDAVVVRLENTIYVTDDHVQLVD